MSTVSIIGHPAPGHVNPNLPLVAELCRRGERAIYYASPPFRARIEKTGAEFRSYGDHAMFERNLGSGGMLGGMAGLLETTEQILPALLKQVQADEPDYLLVEAHAIWGNLLAQITSLPTVALCSMFAINESLIDARGLIGHLYGSASCETALNGLLGLGRYFEIGRRLNCKDAVECPGMINYLGNRQQLNLVFSSREFQPGGASFDDSYKFIGPSVAGRSDEMEFPIESLIGKPLVLISMGTMYNGEAALYRACFEAFAEADCQVVLAVGHRIDRATLPEGPANFIVREYVPQVALLERTALFITHGGINSAHEAMLHGVPMVVLPQSADHFVVASRVEAVGAGIVLHRSQASAGQLRQLAARVFADPEFARNSRRVGETLRAGGGHERAADEIFTFKKQAGIDQEHQHAA